jgi:hypothetical protein
MTARELLTFFENYYGEKYSGVFLDTMAAYLDGYSEKFLIAARKVIVLRFSRTYNKAPDPSVIEKNMDEILATMPKPEALPEPPMERAKTEEFAEFIRQMRLGSNKNTPMSKALNKVLDNLEGAKQ